MEQEKKHGFILTAATVPYLWLLIFFLAPFLLILKISFSEFVLSLPPYAPMFQWVKDGILAIYLNFSNYAFVLSDSLYILSYLDSLAVALAGTIGCLIIGYPIAYGIVRSSERNKTILLMMVILPFWTSFLLRVYAWIGILSPSGIINTILIHMGIIDQPLEMIGNMYSTILGIVYCYLPFMILPLYAALDKIDFNLIEASYDLGAKPLNTLLNVIIPLSFPGIIAGSALVFIPALGEFVIPELLGGSDTLLIGRVIWIEFFNNRDWPVASALAVLSLLLLLIPMLVFRKLEERAVSHED